MTNILLMNKENCALKLVDEIILYYDARSKKHKKNPRHVSSINMPIFREDKLYYHNIWYRHFGNK